MVETELGGVFYLLNLALFLGLYGDFTRPLEPGIALDPWTFLALLSRRLLGRPERRTRSGGSSPGSPARAPSGRRASGAPRELGSSPSSTTASGAGRLRAGHSASSIRPGSRSSPSRARRLPPGSSSRGSSRVCGSSRLFAARPSARAGAAARPLGRAARRVRGHAPADRARPRPGRCARRAPAPAPRARLRHRHPRRRRPAAHRAAARGALRRARPHAGLGSRRRPLRLPPLRMSRFDELPRTPASHFRLHVYGAVLRLRTHLPPPDEHNGLGFLAGYYAELAQAGFAEPARDEHTRWWALRRGLGAPRGRAPAAARAARTAAALDSARAGAALHGRPRRRGRTLRLAVRGAERPARRAAADDGPARDVDGRRRTRATRLQALLGAGLLDAANPEAPRSRWALQVPPVLWDAAARTAAGSARAVGALPAGGGAAGARRAPAPGRDRPTRSRARRALTRRVRS